MKNGKVFFLFIVVAFLVFLFLNVSAWTAERTIQLTIPGCMA